MQDGRTHQDEANVRISESRLRSGRGRTAASLFRRTFGVAIGGVAIVSLVVGCSSSGSSSGSTSSTTGASSVSSSAAPASLQTIKIAVLPTQSNLGIYTAIDNGYFKSAGINVVLTQTSNGPADLAAVVGGSADLGFSEILSATAAIDNGQSLNLVTAVNGGDPVDSSIQKHPSTAPGGNSGAILVSPNSNIGSAADLKGKTIGYNGVPLLKVLIESYLDSNGVDPKSVNYTVISNYAAMGTALAANQVNAVVPIDPFVQEILGANQGKYLANVSAVEPPTSVIAGLWASPSWLKSNSKLAASFVAAFRRGAAAANEMTAQQKVTTLSKFGQFTNLTDLQKQIPTIVDDIHYAIQANVPMTTSSTGLWSVADANKWIAIGVKYGVVPKTTDLGQYLWSTATGTS